VVPAQKGRESRGNRDHEVILSEIPLQEGLYRLKASLPEFFYVNR
jgi:hypothetical protein